MILYCNFGLAVVVLLCLKDGRLKETFGNPSFLHKFCIGIKSSLCNQSVGVKIRVDADLLC